MFEEDIWKQRAKVRWELKGDRNTRYFHSLATASKRTNTINTVKYEGQEHKIQTAKADAFWNFYVKLMGTNSEGTQGINWTNLYEARQDLQKLAKEVTTQEVMQVVK